MKLAVLILLGILLFVLDFFLSNILPDKTDKILWITLSFVSSLIVLFAGVIGLYKLGEFWEMLPQAKIIGGVVCVLAILATIMHGQRRKRRS